MVHSASPAFGSVDGGTVVTVTLSGLGGGWQRESVGVGMGVDAPIDAHSRSVHGLMCRFGEELVDAQRISFEEVQCVAPSADEATDGGGGGGGGAVEVSVSRNGVEFMAAPQRFQYVERVTITDVLPRVLDVRGGEELTVTGTGFIAESGYPAWCMVAGVTTRATVVSPTELRCATNPAAKSAAAVRGLTSTVPSVGGGGVDGFGIGGGVDDGLALSESVARLSLSLLSNGLRHIADSTHSGMTVEYRQPAQVHYVLPASGHTDGSNQVVVVGYNFVNSGGLTCRFGPGHNGATRSAATTATTTATWLSSTRVVCRTPKHDPGTVELSVSNNGVTYHDQGTRENTENFNIHYNFDLI